MAFKSFFRANLSYYRPAFQKADDGIESWITVNGAHIPIKSGQTKGEAVKEHLAEGADKKGSKAIKPEHVSKLHEVAADAKKEIDAFAEKIAGEHGGKVAKAPLKNAERIIEKAIKEYGGDLSKITDIARNTIVVAEHEIEGVIEKLKGHEGFQKHKYQTPEEYSGYSGHLIHVKASNGHVSEIQVNTPVMIYAKDKENNARGILGDDLYNQRPGNGWQTASCYGARRLPYEVSNDAMRPYMMLVQAYLNGRRSELFTLTHEPPASITVKYGYGLKAVDKVLERPAGFDPKTNEDSWEASRPWTYENEYRGQVRNLKAAIGNAQREIKRMEKRLASWKPK